MSDRDAFERRLEDSLRRFADAAPTDVDPGALTRSLAAGAPRRLRVRGVPLARVPSLRTAWALVAVVAVLVVATGALVAGALNGRVAPGSSGRPSAAATQPAIIVPSAVPTASAPAVSATVPGASSTPASAAATYPATLAWSGFGRLPRIDATRPLPGPTMGGVTAAGAGFVAVGGDVDAAGQALAVAWTSADGTTWREHVIGPSGDASAAPLTSVTAAAGIVVAAGPAGVWTSPDGVAWRQVAAASSLDGIPLRVVAGSSRFVALGRTAADPCEARAWTSADGERWTTASIPAAASFCPSGVAAGSVGFVAVGRDSSRGTAAVLTSLDGSDWQPVPAQPAFDGEGYPEGVAATSSGWIAFGSFRPATSPDRGVQIWASPDGVIWRRTGFLRPAGPFACDPASTHMLDVAAFGPGYVAVGSCTANPERVGVAWTSADGTRWQTALGRVRPMVALATDGSRLVAVGSDWPDHQPIAASAVIAP